MYYFTPTFLSNLAFFGLISILIAFNTKLISEGLILTYGIVAISLIGLLSFILLIVKNFKEKRK